MAKKSCKNYIVLVDSHKPNKHSSAGRYRVGAKNEKQAKQFVQNAIKFGSVQVYHEAADTILPFGKVAKELFQNGQFTLEPVLEPN